MIQSSSMLRIFSAASTPFNSGMEISMIMIWLCSFSYSCTASFPLVASLICKISPKRLIKRLARAIRSICSSSAKSTRYINFFLPSFSLIPNACALHFRSSHDIFWCKSQLYGCSAPFFTVNKHFPIFIQTMDPAVNISHTNADLIFCTVI